MPAVVINSGKTGRLERTYESEGEMYAALVAWCVQHDEEVIGTVTIGADDLFTLKAGSTYRVEAGPGDDGTGYLRIVFLSGAS